MHPASTRASRAGVKLQIGPIVIPVDVFSGTYSAPSATSACVGTKEHQHDPTKVATHKVCEICAKNGGVDGEVGIIKSARSSSGGKLAIIPTAAVVEALEASESHQDSMPVVKVSREVYEASALETGSVYWLRPGEGASLEMYAGFAAAIAEEPDAVFITRWAPQKNVGLYRLVSRAGLLGLIKLMPITDLRAAPSEPPALPAGAKDMAKYALGMVGQVGADDVRELAVNPYKETLAIAADAALEEGRGAVRMASQSRATFSDNLAAASLAAMLEGTDL